MNKSQMPTIPSKSRFADKTCAATHKGLQCLLLLTAICILISPAGAQQIPDTQTKALDGSSVHVPDASSGKPLLFVIGFSHQSSDPCGAWNKRISPLYLNDSSILYYEAADLQNVPSLVLRMVLHGMKKDIPANQHSRFLILQSNDAEWKNAVKFSAPNDAYILLTNPAGHIVWQTHGAVTDEQFSALQAAVKTHLGN